MKKIVAILLLGVILTTTTAVALTTTSEDYIPSETSTMVLSTYQLKFNNTNEKTELIEMISICQARKEDAINMAKAARELGYEEAHPVIELAKQEWDNAEEHLIVYTEKYNQILKAEEEKWNKRKVEYPEATAIWLYFKSQGYNDYVIAGIMGNIMAEVGGQTLKLRPYAESKNYYGICQWNKWGYKGVIGADLNKQCEFLNQTIAREFNTYGKAFAKGFDFNTFMSLTNEKDAAKAFAKCYERCSSATYNVRMNNATKAYNYFTK